MQTEMQTALILIRLFSLDQHSLHKKNCKVTASCGSYEYDYFNDKLSDL